jgi:DNA-binding transcriptional LysR family regulator
MTFQHPGDPARAPALHTATRRDAWTAWLEISGAGSSGPGSAGVEYEHFYYMLEAATGGLGVGIAPWPLVIDDIRAGRLIAPFGFVPSGHAYVVARPLRRNRKADAFCRWLAAEAALTPPPPACAGEETAARLP